MKSLWFSDIINEQTIDVKWDVTKRSYIRHSKNYGERCQQKKPKKQLNKMASIFDPAGFHSFIFLFRKIFLKELWKRTIDWVYRITKWQCKLRENGKGS